jgi:hypothetical protein
MQLLALIFVLCGLVISGPAAADLHVHTALFLCQLRA